ncbi:MAG: hypothetical protein ACOY94_21340 [Bacillota bacterium]
MIVPRVTPARDTTVPAAPGLQDNPSLSQLTVERLGMEVAGELGVDPNNLAAYGLTAEKIDQYEASTHSGTQNG